MTNTFFLFRDKRRLCAAYRQFSSFDTMLKTASRRLAPAGTFTHLSHITGEQGLLLGFVVDGLSAVDSSEAWRLWWDRFENREITDFWEAYLLLAKEMPSKWKHDCAQIVVGGQVYSDGAGEYVLAIPDYNGVAFNSNQPVQFWSKVGFEFRDTAIIGRQPHAARVHLTQAVTME
ncbi:MAG: hypothetical protein H7Y43_17100 [Akkermansiaceae bacterium]|nr:hypothetical protein [Verrucomicrobiales bacterium]